YLGQEVVERIRSRGHVNKKLCGLLLEGQKAANVGDQLCAGEKEVGEVTSSIVSPRLQRPIALGHVNKEYWLAGTGVFFGPNKSTIRAIVTALPFAPPLE